MKCEKGGLMLKSLSLRCLLLGLFIASLGMPSWAAEQPVVTAAFGSLSGNAAPLWVAADKGFFKEYGLDTKVLYTRTITGIQALLAREIQFIYTGCSEIMAARRAGSDITLIGATNHYNLYVIASRPDITQPQQLVGKRVAVNRIGDTSHLSARFALSQAGIDPDSVTYVQVGSTPERLAALKSGGVEAALQAVVNLKVVKELGMNVLVNLFERQVPYCGSGIGVSRAFMKVSPRTIEAFMRGFVKGNALFREGNANESRAIMARYMKIGVADKRLMDSYDYYAKQINPRHPFVPREGIAFVLNDLAQKERAWLDWKPEQFFNTGVLDKLKEEGFLDAVYKQIR